MQGGATDGGRCDARVAVVVVNYQRPHDTITAYRSLLDSAHTAWRMFVVDNATTPDSFDTLVDGLPGQTVIASVENLGFAGGCNLGIRQALEDGFDYVFLLNNDAAVTPDALSFLVEESLRQHDRAILGSAIRFSDSGEYQFVGSRTGACGGPEWVVIGGQEVGDEPIESDFVHGAAFFVPMSIFDKIGMFDSRFFLNYEETEFCYRARSQGIASYVVPKSEVMHVSSANLGSFEGPLQTYFLTRNELLFKELRGRKGDLLRALLRRTRWLWGRVKGETLTLEGYSYTTKAMALALVDYLLRRFGDCPTRIRRYSSLAAAMQE